VVAVCGGIWATIQLAFNSAGAALGEDERAACGVEHSEATFTTVTILVCLAAVSAIGLALGRRPRAALMAVALEGALAVLWYALGGERAAGCAIE
jgi:hypothetical protein